MLNHHVQRRVLRKARALYTRVGGLEVTRVGEANEPTLLPDEEVVQLAVVALLVLGLALQPLQGDAGSLEAVLAQ
ncbi:hypothetical protein [Aquisalimonas asiatica]|uniref:hypothetical protein n=1 Tax=Aquisalimonas asiatica TaxID=406100 RepID=UPI001113EF39|nr:hypothetical protein [Aquisalimonas asiatica]